MGLFSAYKNVSIDTKDIISWIFDNPNYDQDGPLYIDAKDPSRSISLSQARVIIRKLVAGFQAAGLERGDCVCIHSFNDIYYPLLFLGIVASGGVFTGTNPSYTEFELTHHIKTSKATFLISEPEILTNALKASKQCGIPDSKIWIFDPISQEVPDGFKSWKVLMEQGEKDWVMFDDENISKNTTAARLFSSGTTGLPKACVLSHFNFVAQHTLVYQINDVPWRRRLLVPLPMFHAACVPMAHTSVLKGGYVAVVMRRFEVEPYFSAIEAFKISELLLVPPMVIAMIMSDLATKYSLMSVRNVAIGAAPLGPESQGRLRKLLPDETPVTQAWGMTEACCVATKFYYPENDTTGSVGRLMPNMDGKLVDGNGKDISAYDTRGELCIRGPNMSPGYFENPKANAESFDSEGFYKTGDILYCDGKTQKWYCIDRKKELIKVRGFQVAPAEIENVLLSHPHIIDTAVIGTKKLSDPGVEFPRAYIVKRPVPESQALDEQTVKIYCGTRLAKYKELTGGVHFVQSIPKNPSGKILKRILRDEAQAELEQHKAKL